MKKLSFFSIAATFAGCFLGAGYVSGQELKQFFGDYGENWIFGLFVAVAFQFLLGVTILLLSRKTGNIAMDRVVVGWNIPWLRFLAGILMVFFLFAINVTMFAAFGAMIEQLTSGAVPAVVGSAVLAAVTGLLALSGLRGMVTAFSLFVPVLAVVSIGICAAALIKNGVTAPTGAAAGSNSLMGGWFISAMTFVSYNIFGSIGMLTPVGQFVSKKRTIVLGIGLGSLALTAIAAAIILAMYSFTESLAAELPMLAVATSLSPALGIIYAVLLFGGMLGTALAGTVAIDIYIQQKKSDLKKYRKPILLSLSAVGFVCSIVGFSDLVGTVYPIFGYCGLVAVVGIFLHYFATCRKKVKLS